jgi:WD40 repeat protein
MASIKDVFLSHTSELREHPPGRSFVAAAEAAVKKARLVVIDQQDFKAANLRVDDYLRDAVGAADVYVGIIGFKYGSLVDRKGPPSYTEREFDYAVEHDLIRFIFLLDETKPVVLPPNQIYDFDFGVEQQRFRKRLEGDRVVKRVTTPEQLETELYTTLVEWLHKPAVTRTTPLFMAPDLPARYVERQGLVSRILEFLDSDEPKTIGLYGDPGSGKRTLAADVCRRVRNRFPDGVLWATLGEHIAEPDERLVAKVNDLTETLSGHRPSLQDSEGAGHTLGRWLGQGKRLLVIDDARRREVLAPFLQGPCMRIVTTRNRDLLPAHAIPIAVGPMTQAEARKLLVHGMDDDGVGELGELARMTRGSPDKILAAREAVRERRMLGADVALAAAHVEACFDRDAGQAPVSNSMALLRDGRPERLGSYLKLAVFPEDVAIPVATLARCWRIDEPAAARLCRELAARSLLDDRDGMRVRDVLRVSAPRLAQYHRELVNAYRVGLPSDDRVATAWWMMPYREPYLWDHLDHHLHEAGRHGGRECDELEALLAHPSWKQACEIRRKGSVDMRDHESPVRAVAISPDGALVASGDREGRILLWSWREDDVLARLSGHEGCAVNSLAFNPTGTWLASAGDDGTVRLWSAIGSSRGLRRGHQGPVNGIAISPDGHWLASAGSDGTVRLWNAAGPPFGGEFRGHAGQVSAVVIWPDGSRLASAGEDGIRLWDATSGGEHPNPIDRKGPLSALAVSPDGEWLATAADRTVELWRASDGSALATLAGHNGVVRAIAIGHDGTLLASGGADREVRLWDGSGTAIGVLAGHSDDVTALAIGPGGDWIASASSDGTVRVALVPPR